MKIGITCATGKLGKRVYFETAKVVGEENVFAICRNEEKAKKLGLKNVRIGNFDDQSEMEKAFENINVVCFITTMEGNEKRKEQNRNVIAACKKMGVKKIVVAGFLLAIPYLAEMMNTLEKEVEESGLVFVYCKNGYYIEPDVRDIPRHISEGEIVNSAGDERLAFTTRDELAFAYAKLLTDQTGKFDNKKYCVHGKSLTFQEFVDLVNKVYESDMKYENLSVEEYNEYLKKRYPDNLYIATVIGSIYSEIAAGRAAGEESHFEEITGRKHVDWLKYLEESKGYENKVND